MKTALLSTTYFGPVQWYQKLCRYHSVLIERHESFVKQTYRNRCLIATAQGVQALTVPVAQDAPLISSVRISDHGNWRHLHWQALQSAYGDSPFFEYYEDDLRPFFTERRWEFLVDFNEDIRRTMCTLLDIEPHVAPTEGYRERAAGPQTPGNPATTRTASAPGLPGDHDAIDDFRDTIRPKHPLEDADFVPRSYYQVFSSRHGFLPNLSILDLLFNMGPESILFLLEH